MLWAGQKKLLLPGHFLYQINFLDSTAVCFHVNKAWFTAAMFMIIWTRPVVIWLFVYIKWNEKSEEVMGRWWIYNQKNFSSRKIYKDTMRSSYTQLWEIRKIYLKGKAIWDNYAVCSASDAKALLCETGIHWSGAGAPETPLQVLNSGPTTFLYYLFLFPHFFKKRIQEYLPTWSFLKIK